MSEVRALPMHITDYPGAFANPERVITIRVRGHLSDDGWGIGGRLETVIDENGNPYPVVGLDPGWVRSCPSCNRRVYLPDSALALGTGTLPCPYTDCAASLHLAATFGDERVEDAPAIWSGGECREHGAGCPR